MEQYALSEPLLTHGWFYDFQRGLQELTLKEAPGEGGFLYCHFASDYKPILPLIASAMACLNVKLLLH